MRHLRLEKAGLRGLAVSESHGPHDSESVLAGVIMRRDLKLDGFVFGSVSITGDDATESVLAMYEGLGRSDISYIMISGAIIAMYNIVDIDGLSHAAGIPVIAVSYGDSAGLDEPIARRFADGSKLSAYRSLGPRQKISDLPVYVRCAGCTAHEARLLVCSLVVDGRRPEPLRVAHALARAALKLRG